LETAVNDARITNNLAANMLNNPSNLGLRPAASGATSSQPTQVPTQQPAASPAASAATSPAAANVNK
jgi:hypothetical protein